MLKKTDVHFNGALIWLEIDERTNVIDQAREFIECRDRLRRLAKRNFNHEANSKAGKKGWLEL